MATLSSFFENLDFPGFINTLYNEGWYNLVFPFLLTYAVVFTILNQASIFDKRKPVKVIIALVFAFFAIAFPINGDYDSCGVQTSAGIASSDCPTLGSLMMGLFPGVSAIAIGILALYIIAGMMGIDLMDFLGSGSRDRATFRWVLGGICTLVVLYFFARGFGWGGFASDNSGFGEFITDPVLYIAILFLLFFFWVTADPEEASEREARRKARRAEYNQENGGHMGNLERNHNH
ncbi:hypothetical protein H6501_00520 [Candidatus Woesearchaeota archaeon]|nr:hypothetical protein [Nanoarchaeota archaeon]MCB9370063.1 hypothetical protein [Candidatus Woesearchaeota archaeon]USN44593.1 MAG: hypothetical protein H6500_01990 [Candidatus Woesearchaeota archaeon]